MSMFRKGGLEKVSSPEQMDDVIRVTTPAVWIALFALIAIPGGNPDLVYIWHGRHA